MKIHKKLFIPLSIVFLFLAVTAYASNLNLLPPQQTPQATSSTPSSKTFNVYDANNNKLGVLMSLAINSSTTFYNETIGKITKIDNNGNINLSVETYYTTSDCSGTSFLSGDYWDDYFFKIGANKFAIVDLSVAPSRSQVLSQSNIMTKDSTCSQITQPLTLDHLRPLKQIQPPFTYPVPAPIKIRYE